MQTDSQQSGSRETTTTVTGQDSAGNLITVTRDTLAKWTNHVVKRATAEAYNATLSEVERQEAIRKAEEDERANRRNFNRMLTLIGALLIGLVITYLLSHPTLLAMVGIPPKTAEMLAPYSFTITILLDSSLALYSYVKKY